MPNPENGGRVTNRDLYDTMTDLRKEIKGDLKDGISEVKEEVQCLDDSIGDLSNRVVKVETENHNLKRQVGAWNIGNTVGVLIAGALAYFGIKND
jgi:hypothetical protein